MVILDRNVYNKKTYEYISDTLCQTIPADPTSSIVRKIKNLLKSAPEPLYNLAKICKPPSHCTAPIIFSQVKTHKEGNPLQPIISKCNAPTINAERALAKFISPHISDHRHTLRSTQHFLELFQPLMTRIDLNLYSADVNSLFPSIPIPHASSLLHDVYTTITPSCAQIESSLTTHILDINYFSFDHQFFRQSSGAPMGSPLSSTLAEVVMQNLEATVLPHFLDFFTIFWFRYVDDIFILSNASLQSIQTILDRMTSTTPQITFSLQPETDGKLAFLDVLITRENSQFHTQVYHKPTANTSIIPSTSMSSRPHKLAAFKSFFTRALTIPSKPEYTHKEVQHIFSIAEQHGFNKTQISHLWYQAKNKLHTQLIPDHSPTFIGSLSYIPGTSERISHWLHRKGYRIATIPGTNIFQSVRSDKPPASLLQDGIYSIPILLPVAPQRLISTQLFGVSANVFLNI